MGGVLRPERTAPTHSDGCHAGTHETTMSGKTPSDGAPAEPTFDEGLPMTIPATLLHPAECFESDTCATAAVHRMEELGIGSIVVTRDGRPVGMVTDRDLALHILDNELDPSEHSVSECMSSVLITVSQEDSVSDVVERMREHGIRRIPVLDSDGKLAGIVSADDLVLLLARDLNHVAAAIRRGFNQEGTETAGTASAVFGRE